MVIESLLGTFLGGAFRLAPEVIKVFDRKNEREHEHRMLDAQIAADRLKAERDIKVSRSKTAAKLGVAELQAMSAAVQVQGKQTGVKWVDAINSLMRPLLTFWWCIILYTTVLVAKFCVLVGGGMEHVNAVLALWGPEEQAIVASIISFWFLDRVLRKGVGV